MKPWQKVGDRQRLHGIVPTTLLVHNDHRAIILDLRRVQRKHIEARGHEPGARRQPALSLRGGHSVGDLGRLLGVKDARVVALPPVLWHEPRARAPRLRDAVAVGTGIVLAVLLLTLSLEWGLYLGWLLGLATWGSITMAWPTRPTHVELLGEPPITSHEILEHVLALERGVDWQPDEPARTGERRLADARARVSAIRHAYGAMRTDLVYRIEQPALFDPGVPTTAAFEEALAAFTGGDGTDLLRLEELAARVEVSFNVAVQHAERKGLSHIPPDNRADVRRAAKAARLAVGAGTDGERQASLAKVRRILDTVALYYLPSTDEALALEPPPS